MTAGEECAVKLLSEKAKGPNHVSMFPIDLQERKIHIQKVISEKQYTSSQCAGHLEESYDLEGLLDTGHVSGICQGSFVRMVANPEFSLENPTLASRRSSNTARNSYCCFQ